MELEIICHASKNHYKFVSKYINRMGVGTVVKWMEGERHGDKYCQQSSGSSPNGVNSQISLSFRCKTVFQVDSGQTFDLPKSKFTFKWKKGQAKSSYNISDCLPLHIYDQYGVFLLVAIIQNIWFSGPFVFSLSSDCNNDGKLNQNKLHNGYGLAIRLRERCTSANYTLKVPALQKCYVPPYTEFCSPSKIATTTIKPKYNRFDDFVNPFDIRYL